MNSRADYELVVGPNLTGPMGQIIALEFAFRENRLDLANREHRQEYRDALEAMEKAIRRRKITLNAIASRLEAEKIDRALEREVQV